MIDASSYRNAGYSELRNTRAVSPIELLRRANRTARVRRLLVKADGAGRRLVEAGEFVDTSPDPRVLRTSMEVEMREAGAKTATPMTRISGKADPCAPHFPKHNGRCDLYRSIICIVPPAHRAYCAPIRAEAPCVSTVSRRRVARYCCRPLN